ncbi:hypothetical protein ACE6H2_016320 [Prunus campanulata]
MEGLDALTAVASIHSQPCAQGFGSKRMKKLPLDGVTSIVDGLKILYRETLKPLELTYNFNDFVSPSLSGPDARSIPRNTIAVNVDLPFSGLSSFGGSFLSKFERSQMPHPLDFNYEFKRAIACLRGHADKIRVILNKADQVNTEQLMRVYGSLMWSLTKVLNTQEAVRIYIGSFHDEPVNEATTGHMGKELFENEEGDLLA